MSNIRDKTNHQEQILVWLLGYEPVAFCFLGESDIDELVFKFNHKGKFLHFGIGNDFGGITDGVTCATRAKPYTKTLHQLIIIQIIS